MQPDAISHQPWRDRKAFDKLSDRKDHPHQGNAIDRRKLHHRSHSSQDQAGSAAEVRYEYEQAGNQSHRQCKAEADQPQTSDVEHGHNQHHSELAAQKF